MRVTVIAATLACACAVVTASSGNAEAASLQALNTTEPTGIEIALLEPDKDNPFASELETLDESNNNSVLTAEETKHTVAQNETLTKIAELYGVTWQRIYDKNTELSDPNNINPGQVLVIPGANEKLASRPLPEPVTTTQSNQTTARSSAPAPQPASVSLRGSSAGNGYVAGYCTWYVKNRRPDLPNNLGNAYSWVSRAAAQGYTTSSTPRAGAVGQRGNHVVYVETVNGDGTITISDMNYQARYQITTRTVPASSFTYIY